MTTLNPGYDFDATEEVTASKLLKWLLGSTPNGIVSYQMEANLGTGFSLSGMSNEGDLEANFSTGKLYIRTRWGMVPVMGGGMFTKRCAMSYNDPDPSGYNQRPFFDTAFKIGPHGMGLTTFTLTDPALMGPGIGPDNAYCYAGHMYIGSNNYKNCIDSWLTTWPSAELEDPTGYDRTVPTCATSIHPTFCLMGFTPMYATISTAYTGCRPLLSATAALSFRSTTGNVDQYLLGTAGAFPMPANFTVASSGTTLLHWGYIMPCLGACTLYGPNRAFNSRI